MRRLVLLIVGGCLAAAVTAGAQILPGTMIGTITDESGSSLPGVTATITSTALPGGPATTVTDEQGRFRFAGLAPGTYDLTLTMDGFAKRQDEGLRVITGGTLERNVVLKVAAVAETITVSGQSPMVD